MRYVIESQHRNCDIETPSHIVVKATGDGLQSEQILEIQIDNAGLDLALRAIEFAKVELLAMQRERSVISN